MKYNKERLTAWPCSTPYDLSDARVLHAVLLELRLHRLAPLMGPVEVDPQHGNTLEELGRAHCSRLGCVARRGGGRERRRAV